MDHLAFPSFDAEETHRFYTEVMGFQLKTAMIGHSEEWDDRQYLMTCFAAGGVEIHFFHLENLRRPRADGLPSDIRHVALSVESRKDFLFWKKRLAARGVPFWVEDQHGYPSVYFADPNGIVFEINCQRHAPLRASAAVRARRAMRRWTGATASNGAKTARQRSRAAAGRSSRSKT
jgi:catechol 2,3-dioxygenase-like lactoylglutathione lyase family enzyme